MYQWDKLSKEYSFGHFNKKYIQIPGLLEYVERTEDSCLLDWGCGTGILSIIFYKERLAVTGVDISAPMIKLAKEQNPGPNYILMDGLKYRSEIPFDIIISNVVICNIPDIEALDDYFKSCQANLKVGGKVYITNHATEFQKTCDYGFAKIEYLSEIFNGCKLNVTLKGLDDNWIGPFINYHWSKEAITASAKKIGLKPIDIISLKSTNRQDAYPDMAKYYLYIFERV